MHASRPPDGKALENPVRQNAIEQSAKDEWTALMPARAVIVLLTAFVCFRFGRYTLARPLDFSDDEGYLLLTLKHYLAGERLYTQVFSQYGPFYFLIQRAIFRALHLAVTYDAGREVFLGYWLVAALMAGIFVYRISRNVTLGSAAALAMMWVERVTAHEPNHPEQMVLVLMMAGCAMARISRRWLLLLGAAGAALFWTKTNVGIFFLAAALIASTCVLREGRLRSVSGRLLVVMAIAAPAVLMHDYFTAWAWRFCVLCILAALGTVVAGLGAAAYGNAALQPLRLVGIGAVAGVVLVPIASAPAGIPFRGEWESVVLASVHQTTVFDLPIGVRMGQLLGGIVLFGLLGAIYGAVRRTEFAGWGHALKCIAGAIALAMLLSGGEQQSGSARLVTLYVLLPLVLLPRNDRLWKASDLFPRVFVAALSAMELLQAYPVAGSQITVAAAPLLLWGFVCLFDGGTDLIELYGRSKQARSRNFGWAPSAAGALVAVAVGAAMFRTGRLQAAYPFAASSLPGSASLHLPPALEANLEAVSRDVRANCGVLFSMPGMGGFNFWSGVPTPDGFNEDNWMKGEPLWEQQQTLERIESNSSACVVVRPAMLPVWGVPPGGVDTLPLARYIVLEMPVVFREPGEWGLEIHVSPKRRDPWVEQAPNGL